MKRFFKIAAVASALACLCSGCYVEEKPPDTTIVKPPDNNTTIVKPPDNNTTIVKPPENHTTIINPPTTGGEGSTTTTTTGH